MRGFTKADVEFHTVGHWGAQHPAVNVKVYGSPDWQEMARFPWITEDQWNGIWDACVEWGRECIEYYASEIWGPKTKVWFEGRSGGWAIVEIAGDIPIDDDVAGWDAIELSKWARFVKQAKAEADDIPAAMIAFAEANLGEPDPKWEWDAFMADLAEYQDEYEPFWIE